MELKARQGTDSHRARPPTGPYSSVIVLPALLTSVVVGVRCSSETECRLSQQYTLCFHFVLKSRHLEFLQQSDVNSSDHFSSGPRKNQFRQLCTPFLFPYLQEESRKDIILKWTFASTNFRTVLLCHKRKRDNMSNAARTLQYYVSAYQGPSSDILGSATAWHRVQRREQFADGNCCLCPCV